MGEGERDVETADGEDGMPEWVGKILELLLALGSFLGGFFATYFLLVAMGVGEFAAQNLSGLSGIGFFAFYLRWSLRHEERKVRRELEEFERYFQARLADVEAAARSAGPFRPGKETSFNKQLVRRVLAELNDRAAALDQPLPSGTKVDTWFEYGGMDWFITVKENLGNQQRLILQGEVEDIILHARPEGIAWIVVVIATDEEVEVNTVGQLHRLRSYLEWRERQLEELSALDASDDREGAKSLVEGKFFLRCLSLPVVTRVPAGEKPSSRT